MPPRRPRWTPLALAALVACGGGGSGGAPVDPGAGPYYPLPLIPLDVPPTAEAARALITGRAYVVDAVNGSDATGDGSPAHPWQTLARAQAAAVGGDGILLRPGSYGVLSDDRTDRTAWLVVMAERADRPAPELLGIDISPAAPGASRLLFHGLRITTAWVDPGGDPQDPASTASSYQDTGYPVVIQDATDVKLHACEVVGTSKYLTPAGVWLQRAARVTIAGCEVHEVGRAVQYDATHDLLVHGNHLHRLTGTAVYSANDQSGHIQVERNHIHDSNYDFGDDWCVRAVGQNPHGSAVSIRSSGVLVRNNVIHDGFNSAGIMTYGDSAERFDDLVLENNVLYDIRNTFVLRLYEAGHDVWIRNNTLVGHLRSASSTSAMRYETALALHSLAQGEDGSGVHLQNNVLVGNVDLGGWAAAVDQAHNVAYALEGASSDSLVVLPRVDHASYFEDGFFVGPVDLSWTTQPNPNDPGELNPVGHGQLIDWRLAPGAVAVGFGDPLLQAHRQPGRAGRGWGRARRRGAAGGAGARCGGVSAVGGHPLR
ncbi:MAG: right-handed parallel beta-helix repeat-containing protein [Anaeromyxobacter sp.]